MSRPSNWPLPPESIRYLIPKRITSALAENTLSRDLYPLATGYDSRAAQHKMERFQHDDYLLIYCLSDRGVIQIDGNTAEVTQGDILLIPENVPHSYQADTDHPWTIYWVHFHGAQAAAFTQHLRSPGEKRAYLLQNIGVHAQLTADFESLLEVRNSAQDMKTHIFSANQLRQILAHIALLRPLADLKEQRDGMQLEQIHSLMQAHVHEKLDLDTLASSANLSKYHFVKRYKEITGTTPINRFIQLKIERACHLLDTTDNRIAEVAYAVGYEDAYYFSRIFRKQLGVSPSQYRLSRTQAFSYIRGREQSRATTD